MASDNFPLRCQPYRPRPSKTGKTKQNKTIQNNTKQYKTIQNNTKQNWDAGGGHTETGTIPAAKLAPQSPQKKSTCGQAAPGFRRGSRPAAAACGGF
jgi:hypothetical protein